MVTNGWQSDLGFLEGEHPETSALREAIHAPLQAYLAELGRVAHGPGAPPTFRYRLRSWAVVLRDGGFQHEHVHSRADVVGVYYVRAPVAAAAPGDLCLVDPRAGRLASRAIWEQTQVRIRPRAGLLVLFPAFVPHRVDLLRGPEERVSINFDVFLEPGRTG
jgi:uncharacterized protein (TIGR02466 family)